MDDYCKKRVKKSDKAKKNFEIYGKFSSKCVRTMENLQMKPNQEKAENTEKIKKD